MNAIDDLRSACSLLREHEPLSRHTSFGIGGPADFYADVSSAQELAAIRQILDKNPMPVFFLGAGSNLLVSDLGIRGLVLHLQGDLRSTEFLDGARVKIGAGAWMPAAVKQCAERGLSGIESLIGVPGTVGGGLVMNAGTREGVLGDVIEAVEAIEKDGAVQTLGRGELAFSYRRSNLEGRWLLSATLLLKAGDRSLIMARIDEYLKYRARTQPLATSNCGSVFKNPPGHAAAQLIEKAGLKGHAAGGARVSERHANFIINEKDARAADVLELIRHIQKTVLEKFSIQLEPEVKLVGQW